MTIDPAMLQWLNGIDNDRKRSPNENYAREMMELFTLGADRGAYTETDIREQARALTGWRADWSDELGAHNFRFDPAAHDTGTKTDLRPAAATGAGRTPAASASRTRFTPPSSSPSCGATSSPPRPPPAPLKALIGIYTRSGTTRSARCVEAILMHPDFYAAPPMVKPPVVYLAGLLRALGRGIDTESWVWLCEQMRAAALPAAERLRLGRRALARHLDA